MKMLNVGFGNLIAVSHLIAVITSDSAPAKRMISNAKDEGIVIDATHGKKTRSILIMDSGHIVLSSFMVETIEKRIDDLEE